MRRFVLISYDICDCKRLRKTFELLRGYGTHIQYSVFLCQLTEKETVVLTEKIKGLIHHKEDQIIFITLGPIDGKRDSLPDRWKVFGVPLSIPDSSVMVY